ncbi:MAG: hypothetical protein K9G62_04195 [Alphaproteobacteria bacterium]|nr:hypothetical protein [Alphaproteobacteria bacterium]
MTHEIPFGRELGLLKFAKLHAQTVKGREATDEELQMACAAGHVHDLKYKVTAPSKAVSAFLTARTRISNTSLNPNSDEAWQKLGFPDGLQGIKTLFQEKGGYQTREEPERLDLCFIPTEKKIYPEESNWRASYGHLLPPKAGG